MEDSPSKIRHDLRTLLNHIVGYSDILREDAHEAGHPELTDIFTKLFKLAGTLRDPLDNLYKDEVPEEAAYGILKAEILSSLFDVVSLSHSAKRISNRDSKKEFIGDIDKMLESANNIVDIVEESSNSRKLSEKGSEESGRETDLRRWKNPTAQLDLSPIQGRILITDDDEINRHIMTRQLERQGHTVVTVDNGKEALALIKRVPFDVIILDVMMPDMNGFQVLEQIKDDERLRDIPVIVISALEDSLAMARCISMGAEDYLPREYDPIILRARISSILEKAKLRKQKDLYVAAVVETQHRLQTELSDAAKYIKSILPPFSNRNGLHAAWSFIPSLSLGGDIFGYHFTQDGRFAVYLIDVSGHGIEAALLSVTIMNVLKSETLPNTDFTDPADVLSVLNKRFHSEDQNNMYFTIWYGVYDPVSRKMTYSSAGNSSSVFIGADGRRGILQTEGVVIGVDDSFTYGNAIADIPSGTKLYIFSDGIYEVRKKKGEIFGLEDLSDILAKLPPEASQEDRLNDLIHIVESISMTNTFEDDVSLIELIFD